MDTLMQITKDTPVVMMTYGQLKEHLSHDLTDHLMQNLFPPPLLEILAKYTEIEEKNTKRYEYGVGGIKRLFHCSYPTAHKLKETILKPAIHQQGRVILIDVDLALKLFKDAKTANSIKDL